MMPLKKKQFFRDMVLLNANNLMRIGELRQLKWGMVKNIKKGKDFYTQYELPAAICKNRKSRTFVTRGGEYINRIKTYSNFTDKDDFVFCNNDDGQQISKTELYRMWADVMEGIDLENYKKRKITFYSLRHFAITGRLYAGVRVYEIAKDTGTSLTYIEKHYDHRVPRTHRQRWRCGTVREMREGPSEPAIRCWLQTTASCCR